MRISIGASPVARRVSGEFSRPGQWFPVPLSFFGLRINRGEPDSGSRAGDRAGVQTAMRMNVEQASKRTMYRPIR